MKTIEETTVIPEYRVWGRSHVQRPCGEAARREDGGARIWLQGGVLPSFLRGKTTQDPILLTSAAVTLQGRR